MVRFVPWDEMWTEKVEGGWRDDDDDETGDRDHSEVEDVKHGR